MIKNTLPNELIAQLDGQKSFDEMTKDEKLKEIEWCIDRCKMNSQDEKPRYFNSQIKQLQKLKNSIK